MMMFWRNIVKYVLYCCSIVAFSLFAALRERELCGFMSVCYFMKIGIRDAGVCVCFKFHGLLAYPTIHCLILNLTARTNLTTSSANRSRRF